MLENPQEPKWQSIYFQPGQIVFLVTGDPSEESNKNLLDWANKLGVTRGLQISKPRVQKFPATSVQTGYARQAGPPPDKPGKERPQTPTAPAERGPFGMIYADVTMSENGERLSDLEADMELLLDLVFTLDRERTSFPEGNVRVVSPNWLTSGSPQPGGTGGPGGRPTPYQGPAHNTEYQFYFAESTPQFLAHLERGTGKGVHVAILDTAPDPNQLQTIYEEWVTKENKNHSLIRTLLDPNNRQLTVHHDPRVDDPPLRDFQCIDHDYDMTDHGLFVAGIIHSLARQAELHLFQVLNRYGVGDLEIVGDALQQVLDRFGAMPLVINLSLNLNIPVEKGHIKSGRSDVSDLIGRKIIDYRLQVGNESWLERVAELAEWICDLADVLGSRVIAAAGNDYDTRQHEQRPQARYPAAFERVVGVGALAKTNTRPSATGQLRSSSYSNLADRPPKSGITTLGGEEGTGEGVLGIYVGKFPSSESNPSEMESPSGWGWWAGTSFATPIISGLAAVVLSNLLEAGQQVTTQEAINELYAAQAIVTMANEDVLFVTQGAPPTTA